MFTWKCGMAYVTYGIHIVGKCTGDNEPHSLAGEISKSFNNHKINPKLAVFALPFIDPVSYTRERRALKFHNLLLICEIGDLTSWEK